MRQLNLNSILLTVVLLLSGWTLSEVSQQGKDAAADREKLAANSREIADLRSRMLSAEVAIVNAQINLARLQRQ